MLLGLALALGAPARADDWKDESGKGRERLGQWLGERREGRDRRDEPRWGVAPPWAPRVPQGHMPPPGECRVWIPGVPAGQQPPPGRC